MACIAGEAFSRLQPEANPSPSGEGGALNLRRRARRAITTSDEERGGRSRGRGGVVEGEAVAQTSSPRMPIAPRHRRGRRRAP